MIETSQITFSSTQDKGPMDGITVIDLTQIYNGPYATFLAAMAGARVIKVEPPGGEHLRKRSARSGAALPFALLNANKEAITLNLKSQEGRRLLLQLVDSADVLVENFAPGVMDRLGLDQRTIRQRNPRIVYASGSGYGQTGPYRSYPAMDLTVQAMSGVMSITGLADGPPLKAGPAICDFFGGVHLYGAIATALLGRERTGMGRSVEVSMLEAVYHSLSSSLGMLYEAGAEGAMRTGNRHGGMSLAPYNVYGTADGHIAIICNNDEHWQALVGVMDRTDLLEDPRFVTMRARVANIDVLDALIEDWSAQRSKSRLFEALIAARVPCAPIRTLNEMTNDPHLHERGMLQSFKHPEFGDITAAHSPLRFLDTPMVPLRASPRLGEHTDSVLGGLLGYDGAQIRIFREQGAV
ncbi:CaiB/BaiF CoA transferase family protein [Bradyrhizobium mercantei]|uniref:CaiB/BaiF CoA transferase family protein n=1 Tax=Bradyrhizobium mercantei TaxID=1904807 RepID=UPI00157CE401|nr:CoA transferase [Bradyrhizobium mercantei]